MNTGVEILSSIWKSPTRSPIDGIESIRFSNAFVVIIDARALPGFGTSFSFKALFISCNPSGIANALFYTNAYRKTTSHRTPKAIMPKMRFSPLCAIAA